MSDVTWFGGAYLAMTVFSLLYMVSQVDEPRKPLTFGAVVTTAVLHGLTIWGLFTVGVTS